MSAAVMNGTFSLTAQFNALYAQVQRGWFPPPVSYCPHYVPNCIQMHPTLSQEGPPD